LETRDFELIRQKAPESCFVIHKQALLRNLETLHRVVREADVELLMALKGYACHATFDWIKPYVSGIAASSPHEAELGHRKMGGALHAYAPAYSRSDIDQLCQWIDHIVFNSREQTERFAPVVRANNPEIGIGVRLNPEHSETPIEIYDPSARQSRLGIRPSEWQHSLLDWISGVHVHNLCENDSHALERTLSALEQNFGDLLRQVEWINFGGGHLITSPNYDVDHLIQLLKDWKHRYSHRIYLEPSETFGLGAGVLKSTVLDIKPGHRDGYPHAILNVSATAHMPDVLEMPYRPEVVGAGLPNANPYPYHLGGVTCLAGDVIGAYSFETPLQVGDMLVFRDMAHYTMVKTTFFNGVQMPAIAVLDSEAQTIQVVREFRYEDFGNKLS